MSHPSPQTDFQAMRGDLEQLVEEFLARRKDGALSESTSEQDIHHWVDRLLASLGWDINDGNEYSRQRYCRGAGTADAVLMDAAKPVCYLEVKRLGGIPFLDLLRQERIYYTPEEEQALRYARRSVDLREKQRWTILTNFEQLYLFEATTEERLMVFEDPRHLVERFHEDTKYLSKAEVLSGGLARWAHRQDRPDVDDEFRVSLNTWRLQLAQEIYDRNKDGLLVTGDGGIDLPNLQRAVQRLLDRLVVLQYATDLEAIQGEPLTELLARTAPTGSALVRPLSLSEELKATFASFDRFYNTSIFSPGHICEQVDVGEDVLRQVVRGIAGQNFRRFTSDILGATYETYLGQVLEVDEDERVRLVVKPEVRRAGGIYYTPTHVVRHIVDKVLDPLLADATEESVADLTVLDPACGSGSFLVAAYEKLADWYESENRKRRGAMTRYAAENPGQAELMREGVPLPDVMSDYHRRILERHLYGVDLDPDAAELAALNIIMTAIRRGMQGLSLEKLPAILDQNIKVGNSVLPGIQSLPGFDLVHELDGRENDLLALRDLRLELEGEPDTTKERDLLRRLTEETATVAAPVLDRLKEDEIDANANRAFVWTVEFPEIFAIDKPESERGFSCVIGNPPWIGFTGAGELRPYLSRRYEMCVGRFDIYVPFVELGLRLLKVGGRFGMITPSNFFLRDYGARLRPWLKANFRIDGIVDWGDAQLFKGATNYPAILVIQAEDPSDDHELLYLRKTYNESDGAKYKQAELDDEHWIFLTPEEQRVFDEMTKPSSVPLLELCDAITEGIITGQNDVFLLSEQQVVEMDLEGSDIVRICPRGQFIKRWSPVLRGAEHVVYPYEVDDDGENKAWEEERLRKDHPLLHKHLLKSKDVPSDEGGLAGRDYMDDSTKGWYELTRPRQRALLERPKIICPEIAAEPTFTVVGPEVFVPNSASAIILKGGQDDDMHYVAGLLNSQVVGRFHQRRSVPKANGYLIYLHAFLKDLPIRFPEGPEREIYERVVFHAKQNSMRTAEIETLELDFNKYIEEYALSESVTVGHWLERVPLKEQQVLSDKKGALRRALTQRVGPILRISGEVRFHDVDYEAGEWELEPIVETRLPEPSFSFLAFYLPWAHLRKKFSSSLKRTFYRKMTTYPVPAMSQEDITRVVETYRRVFDRHAELTTETKASERVIEEAVTELFGLSDEDLKILEVSF